MDESIDNLTLWESSSFSLISFTPVITLRRADTVTARNVLIGSLGILFNTTAIIFLSLKKRLKLTLKTTMIGMAINDFIFTVDGLVFSNPNWTWVSDEPHCWPVIFVMASGIVISYFITTFLALHNYVAVAHPLHCDVIMTKSRSLMGVLVCFGSGYLVILGCLGVNLSPGVLCTVFTLMPRAGLAVECAFCLANCSVIVGLNVAISLKIKESRNIAKNGVRNKTAKAANKGNIHVTSKNNTKKVCVETKAYSRQTEISNDHLQGSKRPDFQYQTSITNDYSNNNNNRIVREQVNKANRQIVPPLNSRQPTRVSSGRSIEDVNNGFSSSRDSETPLSSTGRPRASLIETQKKTTVLGVTPATQRQAKKPIRRIKTNKTLMILTFWSCFTSLPFMVIMIYIAFIAPDRLSFAGSDVGIFIISLCAIHSIGNPLLYIWRFIDWKNVRRQLKSRTCKS